MLRQINGRKYEAVLMAVGVKTLYKYEAALSRKRVEVTVG